MSDSESGLPQSLSYTWTVNLVQEFAPKSSDSFHSGLPSPLSGLVFSLFEFPLWS